MNILDLQGAIGTKVDGHWGDNSRKALLNAFTNTDVAGSKITPDQEAAFAMRLDVSIEQLEAVATVESSGGGWDAQGKPKILFERHKFFGLTGGKWPVSSFNNPAPGGYNESSWNKLLGAIAIGEIDAAFMSCSWGKFQVLGQYWSDYAFKSPFAFAFSTVPSESAHYELLCQYIEHNHLQDEMAAISTNADTCCAFAKGYNGGGYAKFAYNQKLAQAMH